MYTLSTTQGMSSKYLNGSIIILIVICWEMQISYTDYIFLWHTYNFLVSDILYIKNKTKWMVLRDPVKELQQLSKLQMGSLVSRNCQTWFK